MPWYAIYDSRSGALKRLSRHLPDSQRLQARGLVSKDLGEDKPSDAASWNPATLLFDTSADKVARIGAQKWWGAFRPAEITALRTAAWTGEAAVRLADALFILQHNGELPAGLVRNLLGDMETEGVITTNRRRRIRKGLKA